MAYINIAFFVEAVLRKIQYYHCGERANAYPDILNCPVMRVSVVLTKHVLLMLAFAAKS